MSGALAEQVPEQAQQQAVDRLTRFASEVRTYQAAFSQILFDEYGEELERSAGTLALAKPGMFRWQYETPYRQTIVTNGLLLWTFDEDLEQVTINPVPEQQENSPLALLVDGGDIEAQYDIVAGVVDGEARWLALTPKGGNPEYQKIEIALTETDVVAMRLYDNLNQLTALRFDSPIRNESIEASTFEFVIPAGVDVVNGVTQ